MAAIIQEVIQKLTQIGEGIQVGYMATGAAEPVKKISSFASRHFRWFLRLVLVAYAALALYNLFYMHALNPFDVHPIMTLKGLFSIVFKLTTIGIGMYGEFMHSKQCLRIFIILVGLDGMSIWVSVVFINPAGVTALSQREMIERLFSAQKNYQWAIADPNVNKALTPAKLNQQEQIAHDTRAWDVMQSHGCCGLDSYQDWTRVRPPGVAANLWPESCCNNHTVTKAQNKDMFVCKTDDVYKTGCRHMYEEMDAKMNRIKLLIGFLEIVVAVLFYMVEHRSNPDNPSAQLISDHNSLVDMQNALKKSSYPTHNYNNTGYHTRYPAAPGMNYGGHPHASLNQTADLNKDYGSMYSTHQQEHHGLSKDTSDTVVVGQDTKYNSQPGRR